MRTRGGADARSAATRAHQACLRETWLGVGAACFRRGLAAYEDEASPAELAGAARELARQDPLIRSIDGAALLRNLSLIHI